MLAQDSLRPSLLTIEQLDDFLRATLADEGAEENDGVRALIELAVEAPFVVRVRKHFCQVSRELGVDCKLA